MSTLETQPARANGQFAIGGDLPVVRLGYGAMQIPGPGVWGEPRDHDEVVRVLRRALELGVTLIRIYQDANHGFLNQYPELFADHVSAFLNAR